jgi:WD40 repeat protein
MRGKVGSISSASTLLILALIAFGVCNVHCFQATQPSTQSHLLSPPPPSAPHWTYTTGGDVRAVAVSEDGSTIVAGGGLKLYVFGRQDNTTIWIYDTGNDVGEVAVSADGNTIVAAAQTTVILFGRQDNTTIWKYTIGGVVWSVAISADGSTIVTGASDGYVRVFGRLNNSTTWVYKTDEDVDSVAVSADGNTIVAGGNDDKIRVFGRQDNTTIWTYTATWDVYTVAVSADGNTVAAGAGDSFVRVFSRLSNETLWTYKTLGYPFYVVAVSRDGTTIAAGGHDGIFRIFGRTSNATLFQYDTGEDIYRSIASSSDGSAITCGGTGATPKAYSFSKNLGFLWDYSVGGNISRSQLYGPAAGISSDGSLAAYGCDDDKLYVFQYDTVAPELGTPTVVPLSPVGGQKVNISISVTDNVGLSAVILYYRNMSSSSWSSSAMSLAGSVYTARVGPFTSGSTIDYYVSAEDTSGNNASSPADAPLSYHTLTVGSPAGIEWISVLIGAGLGAVIAIIVSILLMRGKKSRR